MKTMRKKSVAEGDGTCDGSEAAPPSVKVGAWRDHSGKRLLQSNREIHFYRFIYLFNRQKKRQSVRTYNIQHTTHNTQHTTHNTQHTTHNTQHTTHNTQHTTHNTQHTTHNRSYGFAEMTDKYLLKIL